jgi:hypothetical protein
MHAIRIQESGNNYGAYNKGSGAAGAYQFEPSTWRGAVSGAGLGQWASTSPNMAPAWVQDAAARWLMQGYFNRFQSWFSVAEAWYGGPGAVGHPTWGGGPGYPNVGQYAQHVIFLMDQICQGVGGGSDSSAGPSGPPVPSGLSILRDVWDSTANIYAKNVPNFLLSIEGSANW